MLSTTAFLSMPRVRSFDQIDFDRPLGESRRDADIYVPEIDDRRRKTQGQTILEKLAGIAAKPSKRANTTPEREAANLPKEDSSAKNNEKSNGDEKSNSDEKSKSHEKRKDFFADLKERLLDFEAKFRPFVPLLSVCLTFYLLDRSLHKRTAATEELYQETMKELQTLDKILSAQFKKGTNSIAAVSRDADLFSINDLFWKRNVIPYPLDEGEIKAQVEQRVRQSFFSWEERINVKVESVIKDCFDTWVSTHDVCHHLWTNPSVSKREVEKICEEKTRSIPISRKDVERICEATMQSTTIPDQVQEAVRQSLNDPSWRWKVQRRIDEVVERRISSDLIEKEREYAKGMMRLEIESKMGLSLTERMKGIAKQEWEQRLNELVWSRIRAEFTEKERQNMKSMMKLEVESKMSNLTGEMKRIARQEMEQQLKELVEEVYRPELRKPSRPVKLKQD
jgi:hypothetical protein